MQKTRWILVAAVVLLLPGLARPAANAPLAVGVTAVGNCKVHGPPATLAFGDLDPLSGRDARATAAVTFKCTRGSSWRVADDGGLHELAAGEYRMRHATLGAHLPYRLTYENAAGTSQGANVNQVLSIEGLVRAGSYAAAPVGNYADTVTITLTP